MSLKTAVNWLFHNNGNETRLRISDGTPLHMSGVNRFLQDKHTLGTLGLTAITFLLTNGDLKSTATAAGGCLANTIMIETLFRSTLHNMFNKKCFNTAPQENQITTPSDMIDANLCKTFSSVTYYLSIAIITLMALNKLNPEKNPAYAAQPALFSFFALTALEFKRQAYRFGQVKREKWVIESTPPAQKKPASEPVLKTGGLQMQIVPAQP
jgi:hypothetical protein